MVRERKVHGNDIIPGNLLEAVRSEPRERSMLLSEWFLVSFRFYIYYTGDDPRKKESLELVKVVSKGSIYYIIKLRAPRKRHHVVASYCFQLGFCSLLPRDENSWQKDTRVLEFARDLGHMPQISPDIVNRSDR